MTEHLTPETPQRRYWRLGIGLITGLIIALLANTPFAKQIEYRLEDIRIRMGADHTPTSTNIVIIAVDDESLQRMDPAVGRWPWPRSLWGVVVNYCSEARVLGMDILFAEKEWDALADTENVFIKEVGQHGHVISAAALGQTDAYSESTEPKELNQFSLNRIIAPKQMQTFPFLLTPMPELLAVTKGLGIVNAEPDIDGVLRQFTLLGRHEENVYPSLALMTAAEALNVPASTIELTQDAHLKVGDCDIPISRSGHFRYRPSNMDQFTIYSVADIFTSWRAIADGDPPLLPPSAFKDKIILIGSTAFGMQSDFKTTPIGTDTPGVFINADVVSSILNEQHIKQLPYSMIVFLIFLGAILPAALFVEHPRSLMLITLAASVGYLCTALFSFQWSSVMLPMAAPLMAIATSGSFLSYRNWHGERTRRRALEILEASKQSFTDMLVHDLKNTVAPMLMIIDVMKSKNVEGEEEENFLNVFDASARRQLAQINALLDIRKMQEGRLQLLCCKGHIKSLLDELVKDYEMSAHHAELAFDIVTPDALTAYMDPQIIRRVLENILWNAIKFSKPGTTIEIRSRALSNQGTEITVANHGRLIPAELIPLLFSAFVSGVEPESFSKVPSTGLGLTFCRLAMEAHQGLITIESPWPGKDNGVQVKLTFPPPPQEIPDRSEKNLVKI